MSGCGRKHRAKHLTRQYLDDDAWSGPVGRQQLAVSLESPHGKHVHVYIVACPSDAVEGPTTTVDLKADIIYLPGKFQKVIWIAANDVVVVVDGTLDQKPSPAQLANFYTQFPAWKEAIQRVQSLVEADRKSERAVISGSMGSEATECVAPVVGRPPEPVKPNESSDDDLALENPNRSSIRHRQAFFQEEDDDEEEEEEEAGDDEG